MYPAGIGYFPQDNSPCHKVCIVHRQFEGHYSEFTLLNCPDQTPDLHPVENLGDKMKRYIRQMETAPLNPKEL